MGKYIKIILIFAVLFLISGEIEAQCAMCKAGVESASKSGAKDMISGLNNGILYLFVMPYSALILLGIVYLAKRKRRLVNHIRSIPLQETIQG